MSEIAAEATEVEDTEPTTEGDISDATTDEPSSDETEPDTFPRSYVEELRRENAGYRDRAKRTDELARRLHVELVRATGRLADPTDLEFDEDHLADEGQLTAAVDELLENKPHLASRRPAGDIGQGNRGTGGEPFSLLGALKART